MLVAGNELAMALAEKTATITGAGSGFGRATTRLFAQRGANVVAVDIDEDAVEETAELIASNDDATGTVMPVSADVSKADEVAAFIDATVDEFGQLDILYNNAGILRGVRAVEELPEEHWDKVNAVNLKSVYLGAKYAVPYMRAQGTGAIVNTASIAGYRPRKGLAAYVASKGGVIMLTKELALELADANIRVNAICPVASQTGLLAGLSEDDIERLRATIPLGRLADPMDIARAAAFLADDEEAGMITGTALEVDGGRGI